jgi:hypothetical protein
LLGATRRAYAEAAGDARALERARQSLFAAEGSDWFGSDQESRDDGMFDELFRGHLRGAYEALDLQVPEVLDGFMVAHPIVWTFTHPVTTIRTIDQVSIRTNCPGRLTHHVDEMSEQSTRLVAVVGVMAGAKRFQVTLGPFPTTAKRLTFRFRCKHPQCDGKAPCCAGDSQEISLGRVRAVAPRRTTNRSNSQRS